MSYSTYLIYSVVERGRGGGGLHTGWNPIHVAQRYFVEMAEVMLLSNAGVHTLNGDVNIKRKAKINGCLLKNESREKHQ